MIKMPAGTYYLGDCCYVLRKEQHPEFDWVRDFCNKFFTTEADRASFDVMGHQVCALNTAYGDGTYPSNIEAIFPVDAGLIGLVPVGLWKGTDEPFGCLKVTFNTDFDVYKEGEGSLVFGHIEIYTAGMPTTRRIAMTKTYFVKVSWVKDAVSRHHDNGSIEIDLTKPAWEVVRKTEDSLFGTWSDKTNFTIDFMMEVPNENP